MKIKKINNILLKTLYVFFYLNVIIVLLCGIMALLTGCGHNGIVFSSGQYANVGYDPQGQRLGVVYINGQQLSMLNRENTSLEIELKDGVNGEGKTIQSIHKIKYTVGKQINGYAVELEKIKKEKEGGSK